MASPGDGRRVVREKVRARLDAGTRLAWVVDPGSRTVTVHHASGGGEPLGEGAELTAPDLLPGWSCRVGEIFP